MLMFGLLLSPLLMTKSCGADHAQFGLYTKSFISVSPDCRWELRFKSDLSGGDDRVRLYDHKSHRLMGSFDMVHTAWVHWLKDNKTLIVNYQLGPGGNEVWLFKLDGHSKPVELGAVIRRDAEGRAQVKPKDEEGYYPVYVGDDRGRLNIAAGIHYGYQWVVSHLDQGDDVCYTYYIKKGHAYQFGFIKKIEGAIGCPLTY